jgi:hypothetical protein
VSSLCIVLAPGFACPDRFSNRMANRTALAARGFHGWSRVLFFTSDPIFARPYFGWQEMQKHLSPAIIELLSFWLSSKAPAELRLQSLGHQSGYQAFLREDT